MRILVLHQYFLGENDPGGSRFNQFARRWTEKGHQVTVLAQTVNYNTGAASEKYRGRLYTEETSSDGIRVLRCYVPMICARNYGGRFWGYIVFVFTSLLAAILRAGPQDIIVATSPPLTIGIAAYALSRLKGIPYVFEVRDLWPEFAIEIGALKNPWLIRMAYALEAFIYRHAARINVLTPAFREHLLSHKDIPDQKLVHIPNGADFDLLGPGAQDNPVRRHYGWGDRFVIMYTGAHGVANDLWQVLKTAEILRDDNSILFVLVGDGNERMALAESASRKGLANLQLIGPQPKRRMAEFINSADACLAVLRKIEGFKTVYPNKVFDYMTCGKPVIVTIDGEARRLVEDAGAGFYAEADNPEALRDAILALQRDPVLCRRLGENGLAYVRRYFDRRALADEYERVLRATVTR